MGRHWRLHFRGRAPIEVITSAPVTRAEILTVRSSCTGIEPITRTHRPATAAEAEELRVLTATVFSDAGDREEALRAALADVASALVCFRALATARRGNP